MKKSAVPLGKTARPRPSPRPLRPKPYTPPPGEADLVRFDWAIKTVLRDKANFEILEGFLSALLKEDIEVIELLESESNQEQELDKFNRVDMLVKDSQGRRTIIEVQNESEPGFISRLLYGTSKVIVENIKLGDDYTQIKKVISISILYFNPGFGSDYIYYGKTEFQGVHDHQPLIDHKSNAPFKTEKVNGKASARLKELAIFPEYYLIPVRVFEDVIESDIDEWIYMFKHSRVPNEFKAKNIDKAREKLAVMQMTIAQAKKYDAYLPGKRHDEQKLAETRQMLAEAHQKVAEARQKVAEAHQKAAEARQEGEKKGREAEHANTERERERAEAAERKIRELQEQLSQRKP